MKGYKAFEKGLVCRGKQYAENTVFEEGEAVVCRRGMHFCKEPLDVLKYYPLVDDNGNITEFAEVEALDECLTDDNEKYCTKKLKIGARIGFPLLVQASVQFDYKKTAKEKKHDAVCEIITSKKKYAKIGSSGDYAQIGSSGDSAQIASEGKYAVVCCAGHNSIAKAKEGSWITLAEWGCNNKENAYIPVCVKTEFVDGDRIKEDTFYRLVGGEFVEVG